ncbi:MAG: hypothetical protein QN178_14070 [Armatimonadota bacterium]|nr:hypothetical protein [Armatimonadota bacterium]
MTTRRRARLKPEDILWPISERTVEAINHNFDILFRDLGLFDDVVPVRLGGTGTDTFAAGDVVYALTSTQLAGLAAVATGMALISQGVGTGPAWGKIGLTTHVSGILPIAYGGTGAATQTDAFDALSPLTQKGDLLAHDGTDNVRVPVGSNGQVLKADSTAPAGVKWDTGGGAHTILDGASHTDAETNSVTRGALVVGQGLPLGGGEFWIDGGVLPDLDSGLATGGQAYWSSGLPDGLLGLDEAGVVRWRRLVPTPGLLTSDGLNVYWGDGTVEQPKAIVYRTSDLSIVHGPGAYGGGTALGTAVPFEAAEEDPLGFWNSGQPTRLTVPTGRDGVYLIAGQASWAPSTTGRKAGWLFVNGVRVGITEVNGDDGGLGLSFTVVRFKRLSAGDYVELVVRQDSGAALNLLGTSTAEYTRLELVRIAR